MDQSTRRKMIKAVRRLMMASAVTHNIAAPIGTKPASQKKGGINSFFSESDYLCSDKTGHECNKGPAFNNTIKKGSYQMRLPINLFIHQM